MKAASDNAPDRAEQGRSARTNPAGRAEGRPVPPAPLPGPEAVTPEWLTRALAAGGAVDRDARVGGRVIEVLHTGNLGSCARFHLEYAAGSGPRSVIGKFASASRAGRLVTAAFRGLEVESRFYRELRPVVTVTTPTPYLNRYQDETRAFTLLMSDGGSAGRRDQIAGCDEESAGAAVERLADLQAPFWNERGLESRSWLNRPDPGNAAFHARMLALLWPGFVDRFGDHVDSDTLPLVEEFPRRLAAYLTARPRPWTLVHGDFRLDNLLFGEGGSGDDLMLLDWQNAAVGPGVTDLAYFMGTSLDPDTRAGCERELVGRYHARLRAGGVADYELDDCWYDYCRYAALGLLMAVAGTSLLEPSERSDALFGVMASRSARMAVELDCLGRFD